MKYENLDDAPVVIRVLGVDVIVDFLAKHPSFLPIQLRNTLYDRYLEGAGVHPTESEIQAAIDWLIAEGAIAKEVRVFTGTVQIGEGTESAATAIIPIVLN